MALASRQGGRVARRQLLAHGIASSTISDWVAKGLLTVVVEGVYAVGHTAETRLSRVWEGLLEEEGTCGFGRTAAWLHDLLTPGALVHIAVRDRSPHTRQGYRFHRPTTLRDEDIVEVDGVPVTSVARTIVDLAGVLPYERLRGVLKQAELLQVLDVVAIAEVLDGIARPRGVRNLRRAVLHVPPRTRSRLERRLLTICADSGLPEPQMNERLEVAPGEWYEVDALWRSTGLVVEVDGDAVHGGVIAKEDDAVKQSALERAGYVVVRAPERDVLWRPQRVTGAIRTALSSSRDG